MNNMTRRSALKLITLGGTALYLEGCAALFRNYKRPEAWSDFSQTPIDRGLGEIARPEFFGDEMSRAHSILWNLGSYTGKPSTSQEKVPLIIVGGGIGGLTTAYLLRKHRPILLEQASRLGGNSKGQSWRGIDFSIGAAYVTELDKGDPQLDLYKELGLHKIYRTTGPHELKVLNGKLQTKFWNGDLAPNNRAQFKKLSSYLRFVLNKRYPKIPFRSRKMENYVKELDRTDIVTHLQKIAGGQLDPLIETDLEYYCWSSFGAEAREISAASGLNFYTTEFGKKHIMPGGNAGIAEHLVKSADLPSNSLRTGCVVIEVQVQSDGVAVRYLDSSKTLRTLHAKAAVLACPKFVVARILKGIESHRLSAIRRLKYRSYLVCNILLDGTMPARSLKEIYDLFMLREKEEPRRHRRATDLVQGSFTSHRKSTVLTLYRPFPYDGARPEMLAEGSYQGFKREFETQIHKEILPIFGFQKENLVDIRISRWGHALPVAQTGLIADGTLEKIRKPFRERVFFVEQDNWALPALDTSVNEALILSPAVEGVLRTA